jgi:hypothetical protein
MAFVGVSVLLFACAFLAVVSSKRFENPDGTLRMPRSKSELVKSNEEDKLFNYVKVGFPFWDVFFFSVLFTLVFSSFFYTCILFLFKNRMDCGSRSAMSA